ncbi:MAG: helix-turn-helix transcriptional regulator [Eubacterium sp.]|nr:helix-turn-helix transcriptional regulator [Eubacterium sp.]
MFDLNELLLNHLTELLDEKGWSLYRLSNESQVPYSTITNMFRRESCPTIFVLKKVCYTLNLDLWEFFYEIETKKRVPDTIDSTEADILSLYRRLDAYDQKLLYNYLAGLSGTPVDPTKSTEN